VYHFIGIYNIVSVIHHNTQMVFLVRSEFFFRTTQELEYLFILSRKARIFFQNLTLGYMTKTLNQIIFSFLHQNQNIFFSNIGNQNIFLEKNITPHPLQVKWSFPYIGVAQIYKKIKGKNIHFYYIGK
jgi:hypothetical protein